MGGGKIDFIQAGCSNYAAGKVYSVEQQYTDYTGADYTLLFKSFRGLTVSKLFRNSIIKTVGLRFDENMRIAEDMAFTLDYILHVDYFCFVKETGYFYRRDNVNSATKRKIKIDLPTNHNEFIHLYFSTLAFIKKYNIDERSAEPKLHQLGRKLFSNITLLYQINLSHSERMRHLRHDYTTAQMNMLRYVDRSLIKILLSKVLIHRHYLIFDISCYLIYKFKHIIDRDGQ